MALFHFGKKKEEETQQRSAQGNGAGITSLKVLGAGCRSCREQYENVKAAAAALQITAEPEYITDMEKVMAYGVMQMPVIVVNERVAAAGRILKAGEVESLLRGISSEA